MFKMVKLLFFISLISMSSHIMPAARPDAARAALEKADRKRSDESKAEAEGLGDDENQLAEERDVHEADEIRRKQALAAYYAGEESKRLDEARSRREEEDRKRLREAVVASSSAAPSGASETPVDYEAISAPQEPPKLGELGDTIRLKFISGNSIEITKKQAMASVVLKAAIEGNPDEKEISLDQHVVLVSLDVLKDVFDVLEPKNPITDAQRKKDIDEYLRGKSKDELVKLIGASHHLDMPIFQQAIKKLKEVLRFGRVDLQDELLFKVLGSLPKDIQISFSPFILAGNYEAQRFVHDTIYRTNNRVSINLAPVKKLKSLLHIMRWTSTGKLLFVDGVWQTKVWDMESPTDKKISSSHGSGVRNAFPSDYIGEKVNAEGGDCVSVFDCLCVDTQKITKVRINASLRSNVSISCDGRYIAGYATRKGSRSTITLHIAETATGNIISAFTLKDAINQRAYLLWAPNAQKLLCLYEGNKGQNKVSIFDFSHSKGLTYNSSWPMAVDFWNIYNDDYYPEWSPNSEYVAFRNLKSLLPGELSKTIDIIHVKNGHKVIIFAGEDSCTLISFSPDSQWIAIAERGQSLSIHSALTGEVPYVIELERLGAGWFTDIAWGPDNLLAITDCSDENINIFDMKPLMAKIEGCLSMPISHAQLLMKLVKNPLARLSKIEHGYLESFNPAVKSAITKRIHDFTAARKERRKKIYAAVVAVATVSSVLAYLLYSGRKK